jgi:hypothetical protein
VRQAPVEDACACARPARQQVSISCLL